MGSPQDVVALIRLREAAAKRAELVTAEAELVAAILFAFAAGVPKRAIAREAGVVRQTVYNVLARQGREEGETA